ncbi:MAG: PTS sugar transporter subunit IIA [Spirochaetales bacterium]|nr:PTS sugar transporter subunit IIA [Spirochaetales bacterium]
MEIILGLLALELGIVSETTFVAVVFGAVFSSIIVGPLFAWTIRKRRLFDIGSFLRSDLVVANVKAADRWQAIEELASLAAARRNDCDAATTARAVHDREELMSTGLEKGMAVPHARLKGISSPCIVFGRSVSGIDWDARDGGLTHFIFLILTPEEEVGMQVQILSGLAKFILQDHVQSSIFRMNESDKMFQFLHDSLQPRGELAPPTR